MTTCQWTVLQKWIGNSVAAAVVAAAEAAVEIEVSSRALTEPGHDESKETSPPLSQVADADAAAEVQQSRRHFQNRLAYQI